ncbi:hypothetical protein GCM10020370_47230 [Paenibacillus hodogayensis]
MQDILKADELANIWDADPIVLLDNKKKSDWLSVENQLQAAKYGPLVETLKNNNPEAAKRLEGADLPLGDQLSLLTLVNEYLVPDMNEALRRYRSKGKEAVSEMFKENRFYGEVSKPVMDKYGLTDEEVKILRLTDEKLAKMEQSSEYSLADTLDKMRISQQKRQGALDTAADKKGKELP